ncbi:hypothetical protein Gotri_015628, partial [Gossypium trilobum]|nr:hypothetical protein [Gossypium trilobum]
ARKNAHRIPKGVIHVQASFNNTIVIVTNVLGRVISWSSAGTCGFEGTRRGTPFAAQTAAGNAIRAVNLLSNGLLCFDVEAEFFPQNPLDFVMVVPLRFKKPM